MTDEPRQTDAAVRVDRLSFTYAPTRRTGSPVAALDDISLTVDTGEVFGLLGPNGSGKTTLFRIISTMQSPASRGHVTVFGHDVAEAPDAVRRKLGVVFQSASLDDELTAAENLAVHGRLYGLSRTDIRQRRDQWLERFDLAGRADEAVSRFSGGMRRRVEIARALMSEPRLLLMDEPTNGLDPTARRELWDLLLALRAERGMTLLLSTHLMEEAERCDRLAVMDSGRIVAIDRPDALRRQVGGVVVTLTLGSQTTGDEAQQLAERIAEQFGPFDAHASPRVVDQAVRFEHCEGPAVAASIAKTLGTQVQSLSVGRPTLDDVFVRLTGRRLGDDA